MRVVSPAEMRQIEEQLFKKWGMDENLIIENVGAQGAHFIFKKIISRVNDNPTFKEIVFFVGPGNNGADALAIARHLANKNINTRAFILFPDDLDKKKSLSLQLQLARNYGVKINEIRSAEQVSAYFSETQEHYIVVDGIYGTGFKLPLSQYIFDIINLINNYSDITISIDIPSGLTGNNGQTSSSAVFATHTLAIGLPKKGHYSITASSYIGKLSVLDAHFPTKLLSGGDKVLMTDEVVKGLFFNRNPTGHKNTFGHVLVVGGSSGQTGAPLMAALAALKSGTGLVTCATWPLYYDELVCRLPLEIMAATIPLGDHELDGTLRDLDRFSTVVIGPGLGKTAETRKIVLSLLASFSGGVVLDADALNVLDIKKDHTILAERLGPTILTPHVGEFAHLLSVDNQHVLKYPTKCLKQLVDLINCTVILKGPCTYIGVPNGTLYINYAPNDGMATAGCGDVLAGLAGGMLAQMGQGKNLMIEEAMKAATLSVYAHSLAGKLAQQSLGARAMTATSVIDFLAASFISLEEMSEGQYEKN